MACSDYQIKRYRSKIKNARKINKYICDDATEEIITLDVEKIDFDDKEATKELFRKLLNFIEFQAQEIRRLNEIIQQQSDEIARLKGEKGKPKIAPKVPPRDPRPSSTEKSKKWSKDSKNPKIKIDRVVY